MSLSVPISLALAINGGLGPTDVRDLLWRTVEVCLFDLRQFGSAAPCLAVKNENSADLGFAVVRAPADKSHVIVTPIVRLSGIEAPQLTRPNAPNYLEDAWQSRSFAYPPRLPPPQSSEMALAINSQQGRSQDQLHIHIDCVNQTAQHRAAAAISSVTAGTWTSAQLLHGLVYSVTLLPIANLGQVNEIRLAAAHLKLGPEQMKNLTLAVFSLSNTPGKPGFVLLARDDKLNSGHAEMLLDRNCAEYGRRKRPDDDFR